MKRGFIIVAVVVLIAVGGVFFQRTSIQIASGATSQNVCTKTFVSGLNPDEVYAQDMRPEPPHSNR